MICFSIKALKGRYLVFLILKFALREHLRKSCFTERKMLRLLQCLAMVNLVKMANVAFAQMTFILGKSPSDFYFLEAVFL